MAEPWIERELGRHLGPVNAPADLWAAIHRPRSAAARSSSLEWVFLPIAAMILMLAVAGVLRSHTNNTTAQATGAAANCHTPNFAQRAVIPVAAVRNARESCLSCHLSMPGTIVVAQP